MRILLFGRLAIRSSAGEPVRLATRKAALLIAALALLSEKGARREALSEAFWSDRGEAQARSSLRQALVAARRALQDKKDSPIGIDGDGDVVKIVARPDDIDVWLFDQLIRANDLPSLTRAADLYQGDLVADVALPEPLDQWFAPFQQDYRRKVLMIVEQLSQTEAQSFAAAATACQALAERLLAADRTTEEAHRALIQLYQRQGRVNAALRQFELCKEALQQELGVEPETRTRELIASRPSDNPTMNPGAAPAPQTQLQSALPTPPSRDRDQPSVVVMPFDNLSGEADEYFADGVVEEITAALSRVRDFFVIARQSAFTYKGRFVDVRDVGKELGVRYVVEGTVRRGGERLRISVQLVDAATGTQLWSDRYEGVATHLFEFQDQTAAKVAGAMYPAVRGAEINSAKRKPPSSLRAYDLVMQAFPKLWGNNASAINEGIATLTQAIAIDPLYGRAHALLAWCHSLKLVYDWSPSNDEELEETRRCIEAATGLINDDPTALTASGAAMSLCGDHEKGLAFIDRALALDPNNAWAWTRRGWVAVYRENAEQAKDSFERAMALSPLDPFSANMKMGLAASLAQLDRLSEAVAIALDVVNKHPEVTWAHRQLVAWSAMNGDMNTASWAAKHLLRLQPHFSINRYTAMPAFRKMTQYRERMAAALRQAGLPE